MPYSLFDNPFAVLGLANTATAQEASDRARQIGTPEAAVAMRSLIVPRTRLEAEIRFLPGLTFEVAASTLTALRAGEMPDLRHFPFLARANVLAHLASSGKDDLTMLRELVGLQTRLTRDVVLDLVTADRAVAGMPKPNDKLLDDDLEMLAEKHAGALVTGLRSLGETQGAGHPAELVKETKPADARRAAFLRKTSTGWARKTASTATQLQEEANRLEHTLSSKATGKAAEALTRTIRAWALVTAPQRATDVASGLTHRASVDTVGRWLGLAVRITNEQSAAREALVILETLADEFGSLPDIGARIRDNLRTCQGLVSAAREHEAIMQLEAAIAEADKERETLGRSLNGDEPTSSAPPIVTKLRDALVEALQTAPGERPWLVWRAFTLRLHNQFQLTAAALSLMRLAVTIVHSPAAEGRIPGPVTERLKADVRVLEGELASRKLKEAMEANRTREAITLVDQLIALEPDAAESRKWQQIRLELERRLEKRRLKAGLWIAGAAAFFIWGVSQGPTSGYSA